MNESIDFASIANILLPLLIIQLILMVIAIVLCIRARETRGPKWMWILIILFFNLLGSVAFFVFGRRNS
ncbi:PLD nuclease N-terminal domain-containing protein [Paenibacillus sp. GCM10027627]|uniref:PLD nuclease N-terminal domain-containing protein n=1 Tax=unclassified Paenibacillus TaxID=185978 RepID=UPI00362DF943